MQSRADRAKLFRHGGSQPVRLPKKYRFEQQTEVVIRKEGKRVVREPVSRRWSDRFLKLAGSAPDYPYPTDPPPEPCPNLDD